MCFNFLPILLSKIFIIVDIKSEKLMDPIDRTPKYHMPLRACARRDITFAKSICANT